MHPEIDRYAYLDSPLHRWDARWKVAGLGVLLLSIAVLPAAAPAGEPPARQLSRSLVALAMSLVLVQVSRIPLPFALVRVWPAALFLLAFVLIYACLGTPADGQASIEVAFSRPRAVHAAAIAARALAVVLLVFPMFGTSRFDTTMKALRALRLPAPLVQLTVFAYRYLYVYADELRRIRAAMRARGFRNRPIVHAARTAGNAVGMLLVRSVERTDLIYRAMKARGYAGAFPTLEEFATRRSDVLKAVAAAVAAAGLLCLGAIS